MHIECSRVQPRGPRIIATTVIAIVSLHVHAQAAPPGIIVDGDLSSTGTISLEELKSSPNAVETSWTEHGNVHKVRGLPLVEALAKFGAAPGPEGKTVPVREKRSGWKMAVVAQGADGYQAGFSFAEVSPEIGNTQAFVAFEIDDKPISDDRGPARLVVPTDREPARAVYQLRRLSVVDMRKVVSIKDTSEKADSK